MKIKKWEIWHTYSSYFSSSFPDLELAAKILVEKGIAVCSMHIDGRTYWKTEGVTFSGNTVITQNEDSKSGELSLRRDDDTIPLHNSILNCWNEMARMRHEEILLCGNNDRGYPTSYIRLFLGEFLFVNGTDAILCMPFVKIYDTGVITFQYRLVSKSGEVIATGKFVDEFLSLPNRRFDKVLVPSGISRAVSLAYMHIAGAEISIRHSLLRSYMRHSRMVEKEASVEWPKFAASMVPLESGEEYECLRDVFLSIVDAIGFTVSDPRNEFMFMIFGPKPFIRKGGYWHGHPHIHLIDFEEQSQKASENEKLYKHDLSCIMAGFWRENESFPDQVLPMSGRGFEDYGVYISSASVLWVWSRSGIESGVPPEAPDRADYVIGHQVIGEMLEYGFMLRHALFGRSFSYQNSAEVLAARQALIVFENELRETTRYGELRELLNRGWERMGSALLTEAIKESLEVKKIEVAQNDADRREKVNRVLALVLGLIAVPDLATEVVNPLWTYFSFWQPETSLQKPFFVGISVFAVLLVVPTIFALINRGLRRH